MLLASLGHGAEAPFTEAKFTEVTGEVTVASATDATAKTPATINGLFHAPDTLHTGRRSHAQLTAADGTIARVGSNTVFALEPASRTIKLSEGSILFNSPKGIGGGTIVTNSATATVTGTTIIVAATSNGGFKVLVLEGAAQVTFPGGQVVTLGAGQMTFVLPGPSTGGNSGKGGTPGPVVNFDLAVQTQGSSLVNGFSAPLPSTSLILDATHNQQVQISSGDLSPTGQAVVGASSPTQILLVDSDTLAQATKTTPVNTNNDNYDNSYGSDPLSQALGTTVNLAPGSIVPPANIFLSPITVTAADLGSGVIPQSLNSKGQFSVRGIIAGAINASGNLDLAAFDGLEEVDLYANYRNSSYYSLNFTGNTNITLPASVHQFGLYSNLVYFYPGIRLDVTFGNDQNSSNLRPAIAPSFEFFDEEDKLDFGSVDSVNLSAISITNRSGSVRLSTLAGNMTLSESFVRGSNGNAQLNAARGSINLLESTLSGGVGFAALVNANGAITVDDSTLEASDRDGSNFGTIGLNSFANISVQNTALAGDELKAFAAGNLSLRNLDTSKLNLGTLFILAAPTVSLSDFNFPDDSEVEIYTKSGVLADNPNISGNTVAGDLNFFNNVTYGGNDTFAGDPAEAFIGNQIILGLTADNPGVQAALAITLNLNAESIPVNNTFENVFFTPANIGRYNNAIHADTLKVDFGVIAGTLTLGGGNIDLSNVSNPDERAELQLVGLNGISFSGVNQLLVPSGYTDIEFWSRSFNFAPNSSLTAQFADEFGDLGFTSLGKLALVHATLTNPFGGISFLGLEDDLVLSNTSITAQTFLDLDTNGNAADAVVNNSQVISQEDSINISGEGVAITNSTVDAHEGVFIDGLKRGTAIISSNVIAELGADVDITGGFVTVGQSNLTVTNDESDRGVQLSATTRITVSDSHLTSNFGGYIELDGGEIVSVKNGMLDAPLILASADQMITLNHVDVSTATEVDMSARTIVLSDINFKDGSTVNLSSDNGVLASHPNTNRAPVVGDVNFIKNVNYGGQPAQNFVSTSAGGTSTSETPPITIGSRGH